MKQDISTLDSSINKKLIQMIDKSAKQYISNFIEETVNNYKNSIESSFSFTEIDDIVNSFSTRLKIMKKSKKIKVVKKKIDKDTIFKITVPLQNKLNYFITIIIVIGVYQISLWCGIQEGQLSFYYMHAYKEVLKIISELIENDHNELNKIVDEYYDKYFISAKNVEIIFNTIDSLLSLKLKPKKNLYTLIDEPLLLKIYYGENEKYELYYNDFLKNPKIFMNFLENL